MTATLAASTAGATGAAISRLLTAPHRGRRYTTRVHGTIKHDRRCLVLLDDTEQTRQPGPFGAYLPDGTHVKFGTETLDWDGRVARPVSPDDAHALESATWISWTGIPSPTPSTVGLIASEIIVDAEAGPCPAWQIGPDDNDLWAIHIHGMGSSRSGALRGARVAAEIGATSLIVTYRNAAEGPPYGSRRPALGTTEVHDVSAALEYATLRGARRIVVFGWSMGANIALKLAHVPRWRHLILGIVAESPILDWRATIETSLAQVSMPSLTARLAYPWLEKGHLARIIGLDQPIDLDELDWTAKRRIEVPLLVLQGTADRLAPWRRARKVAADNDLVDLELFDAGHTLTWNSDPARWNITVSEWMNDRLSSTVSS